MSWPIFQGILACVALVFGLASASLMWADAVNWSRAKLGAGWTFVAACVLATIGLATVTGVSA